MGKLSRLLTVLATIALALSCRPDLRGADDRQQWRSVSRIRGAISINYHTWVHEAGIGTGEVSATRELAQVRFVLEADPALTGPQIAWRATSATITGSIEGATTYHIFKHYRPNHLSASFTGDAAGMKDFSLMLDVASGKWQIVSPGFLAQEYTVTNVYSGKDSEVDTWKSNKVMSGIFDGVFEGKPGTVSGQFFYEDKVAGKSTRGVRKEGRIHFWPELDDVAVEITIEDYDRWRPLGSIQNPAKPGNSLKARATLVPKGPRNRPLPDIDRFRFLLIDVSREPGVCLNWPLQAKDKDYDLRFAKHPTGTLSNSDLTLEVKDATRDDKNQPYAETSVDSFDFGGRAICVLADGREVEGALVGTNDIPRLPKMNGPGWIADNWKTERKVSALADDDDNEAVSGQIYTGDGYTLYEEYRGWAEAGRHVEGDPLKKDLFVRNKIGADAIGGFRLFERVSKVRVFHKLRPSEMVELAMVYVEADANAKGERIMNLNHRDAPHRVDQHAIIIENRSGFRSSGGRTDGVFNNDRRNLAFRPGKVRAVGMEVRTVSDGIFSLERSTSNYNLSAADAARAYDRGVAHELLHAVGVDHHGEGEDPGTFYFQGAGDPTNPTRKPRYVRRMPPTDSEYGQTKFGAPKTWSDFDRGPTVTLLWEDTLQDVAQSESPAFEQELAQERSRPAMGSLDGSRATRFPQYGKSAEFWSELGLYEDVSSGATRKHFVEKNGRRFDRWVTIGNLKQADSGNELCLMRYYFANAYPVPGRKDTYYLVRPGGNKIGFEVCGSPEGTGANAPSHCPRSRFGDAAAGRGACFKYICPNDAIPGRAL